tara:strand:+ start:44 stop:337 length:294 start_codon:yes stop_codon:yes gene_type:complete
MIVKIISTFYNSYNDESHQNILDFNLSKEQLNKYTLKEYAEHVNDWIHTDDDITKMSFCFQCTPLESKRYTMTKDLFSNNGKVYFEYDKTNKELITL